MKKMYVLLFTISIFLMNSYPQTPVLVSERDAVSLKTAGADLSGPDGIPQNKFETPLPISETAHRFIISGTLGVSSSNGKSALDDFELSKFESQNPNFGAAIHFFVGKAGIIAIGVKYARYTLRLVETGAEFGDLIMSPIMGSLRIQREFGSTVFYMEVNLGYSSNDFTKGKDIKSMESYYAPAVFEITNESSLYWGLSMGLGIKLTDNLYLTGEGEIGGSSVKTSWYAVAPGAKVKVDFEKFNPLILGGRVGLMIGF